MELYKRFQRGDPISSPTALQFDSSKFLLFLSKIYGGNIEIHTVQKDSTTM